MSKLHTKIDAQITVLSPLHIGSGTKLKRDFDWLARNDRVYIFDHNTLFDVVLQRAEADKGADAAALTTTLMAMDLPDLEKAGWLERGDFHDEKSSLFRYVLRGQPHLAEISEQIKGAFGRPYLPGSSLKGALRTVLAWGVYTKTKRQPDLRRLKPSRSWAAQPLEQAVFGPNPNHDWLRALQVSDGPALPPDSLHLEGVRVYPTARQRSGSGLDLDVEVIHHGTTFTVPLTIDEYGFQEEAARQLRWQGQRDWLTRLAELGREHARQRLQLEAEYFKSERHPVGVRRFYHELIDIFSKLKSNEFIVQIGWGGGWDSKTFDGLLKQDARAFEQRVLKNRNYRMLRRESRRKSGDTFPACRRLVLRNNELVLPLGWIKVELL
jgi:CRISPR-associated protein Csm5